MSARVGPRHGKRSGQVNCVVDRSGRVDPYFSHYIFSAQRSFHGPRQKL